MINWLVGLVLFMLVQGIHLLAVVLVMDFFIGVLIFGLRIVNDMEFRNLSAVEKIKQFRPYYFSSLVNKIKKAWKGRRKKLVN